jgi:hypothetical protein
VILCSEAHVSDETLPHPEAPPVITLRKEELAEAGLSGTVYRYDRDRIFAAISRIAQRRSVA